MPEDWQSVGTASGGAAPELLRDVEAAATLIEAFRRPRGSNPRASWLRSSPALDQDGCLRPVVFFRSSVCSARAALRLIFPKGLFAEPARSAIALERGLEGVELVLVVVCSSSCVDERVTNLNVKRSTGPKVEVFAREQLPLWEPEHLLQLVLARDAQRALAALGGGVRSEELQEVFPLSPEVIFTGAVEGDVVACVSPRGLSFYVAAPRGCSLPARERILARVRRMSAERARRSQQLLLKRTAARFCVGRKAFVHPESLDLLTSQCPELTAALVEAAGPMQQWPPGALQAVLLGALEAPAALEAGAAGAAGAAGSDSCADSCSDLESESGSESDGLPSGPPAFAQTALCVEEEVVQDQTSPEAVYRRQLAERLYREYDCPSLAARGELRAAGPGLLVVAGRYDGRSCDVDGRRAFWLEAQRAGLSRDLCSVAKGVEGEEVSFTQRVVALLDYLNYEL